MQALNNDAVTAVSREELLKTYKYLIEFTSVPRLFDDFHKFDACVRSGAGCDAKSMRELEAVRQFLYGSAASESYLARAVKRGGNPPVNVVEKGVTKAVPLNELLGELQNPGILGNVRKRQGAFISESASSVLGMGGGVETETSKLRGIAERIDRYVSDPSSANPKEIMGQVLALDPHKILGELRTASLYLSLMERLEIVDPLAAATLKINIRA
jgi:hypothetical protein